MVHIQIRSALLSCIKRDTLLNLLHLLGPLDRDFAMDFTDSFAFGLGERKPSGDGGDDGLWVLVGESSAAAKKLRRVGPRDGDLSGGGAREAAAMTASSLSGVELGAIDLLLRLVGVVALLPLLDGLREVGELTLLLRSLAFLTLAFASFAALSTCVIVSLGVGGAEMTWVTVEAEVEVVLSGGGGASSPQPASPPPMPILARPGVAGSDEAAEAAADEAAAAIADRIPSADSIAWLSRSLACERLSLSFVGVPGAGGPAVVAIVPLDAAGGGALASKMRARPGGLRGDANSDDNSWRGKGDGVSTEPAREEAPGVVGGGSADWVPESDLARPARLPPRREGVEGMEEEHRGCVALLTIAPPPPSAPPPPAPIPAVGVVSPLRARSTYS